MGSQRSHGQLEITWAVGAYMGSGEALDIGVIA